MLICRLNYDIKSSYVQHKANTRVEMNAKKKRQQQWKVAKNGIECMTDNPFWSNCSNQVKFVKIVVCKKSLVVNLNHSSFQFVSPTYLGFFGVPYTRVREIYIHCMKVTIFYKAELSEMLFMFTFDPHKQNAKQSDPHFILVLLTLFYSSCANIF